MHDEKVFAANKKWLPTIVNYSEAIYRHYWLPSHDIRHHMRVWRYAQSLAGHLKFSDPLFYDKLLLACMFHDIGLSVTMDPIHGKESRLICEEFLRLHSSMVNFNTNQLLEAIEKHDDKNYTSSLLGNENLFHEILTVADDIDAFGAIGLYRYVEIYLLRGVEKDLGNSISQNAQNRYNHCIKFFQKSKIPNFYFQSRFDILMDLLHEQGFSSPLGKLVTFINTMIIRPKKNPEVVIAELQEKIREDRISFFMAQFLKEMENEGSD